MTDVPPENMRLDDALNSGDRDVIRAKLLALLRNVDDGGGHITIYSAQACLSELLRLDVLKLERSSKNLERLTKVLICLTIVLGIIAIPPAIEAIKHLLR